MGVHENISFDKFPKQYESINKDVIVCFYYDTTKTINGIIVRDDSEPPYRTIIKLEDGRYVLATECQYTLP